MNDLSNMHDAANNALVRLLSERVRGLRGSVSDIGTAIEGLAGRPLTPDDAPGVADESADSGRDQGPIA